MILNSSKKTAAVLLILGILLVLSGCIQSSKESELKQTVLSKPVVDFKSLPSSETEQASQQSDASQLQDLLVQEASPSAGVQAVIDKSPGVQPEEKPELKKPPLTSIGKSEIPIGQDALISQNISKIAGLFSDLSGLQVQGLYEIKTVTGEQKPGNSGSFYSLESITPWPAFNPFVTSVAVTPKKLYSTVGLGCHGVKTTEKIPIFDKPQRINVLVYFQESEKTVRYGIDVDPGREQPLIAKDAGFENPTINVYAKNDAIERIFSAPDPLTQLSTELGQEQIVLEGADFGTSIELMLAKGALQALVSKSEGFVEKSDCDEIRQKWLELKQKQAAFDCEKIRAEFNAANQRKELTEKELEQTKKESGKAREDLQKAQDSLQNFLKQGLQGNDYKFEQPSDAQNWNNVNYPRHGTKVWFKGDGQKLIDFYKTFEKEIAALKERIESSIKKAESLEMLQKTQELDLAQAEKEVEDLGKKLSDCEQQKESLAHEIQEFEKLYENCLKKLAEQQEVVEKASGLAQGGITVQKENSETGALVGKFEELDRQILQDPRSSKNKDCEKVKELQEEARKALEAAKEKEQAAKYHYEVSKTSLESGNIEDSKKHLADSAAFLEEARKLSIEASEKAQKALREKQDCLSSLRQQELNAQELAKEAEKWKKALESDNNSGLKPVELDKDQIRRGMDWALQDVIIGEIFEGKSCDCPLKALIAADYLVRQVNVELFYKLGLDVIKAPIDALTPEGLAGKIAQRLASYTLTYLGSDDLSDAAIDILTGELVEKILPGTDIDLIDKPAQNFTSESLADLLKNSSVKFATFESNQTINSTTCGQYSCNVKVVVFYNPNTHYLISLIRSDCCPGTIMLSYETDEDGFPQGSPEVTVLN